MGVHVESGSGAPTSAPPTKNAHYLDTTNEEWYFAVDTAASSDWIGPFGSSSTIEKKTETLTFGAGGGTQTMTHNLGTKDITKGFRRTDIDPDESWNPDVEYNSGDPTNKLDVTVGFEMTLEATVIG